MRRALLLLCLAPPIYAIYVLWGLPSRAEVRAVARTTPRKTGVMRQRQAEASAAGRRLREVQIVVPLSRISRNLVHAVVAAEDAKFFGHEGIDWEAIKESVELNVRKASFARGGSTITQQLAKNLFFTTQKGITRKLREFIVARWLEEDLTKKRILELYLNVIEWGDGVYGCEAAARRYYGKPAANLGPSEAAGLAAMIPSPRRINPRTSPRTHARAQKRVLWLMAHAGYLNRSEAGLGAEPPPEPVEESGPEPTEPAAPPQAEAPAPAAGSLPFTPP